MQCSTTFCSRVEAAGHIISSGLVWLIVPNKAVKFRDHPLDHSREIRPKLVRSSFCDSFFHDSFRLQEVSDVIPGVAVDQVGMDVHENLVILGQSVLEIYEPLTLW